MLEIPTSEVAAELGRAPVGLAELPGVHDPHVEGKRVRCQVDAAGLEGLLSHLTPFGVRSLTSRPPTLEDLFLRHYETEGREAEGAGRTAGSADGGGAMKAFARAFAGTGALVRLIVRRHRVVLPVWVLSLVLLPVAIATPWLRGPIGLAWRLQRGLLGLVGAGYAIGAALRLRGEESSGRAEPVLAASVSRRRWAASHLAPSHPLYDGTNRKRTLER